MSGARWKTRTFDLLNISQALWPTELSEQCIANPLYKDYTKYYQGPRFLRSLDSIATLGGLPLRLFAIIFQSGL